MRRATSHCRYCLVRKSITHHQHYSRDILDYVNTHWTPWRVKPRMHLQVQKNPQPVTPDGALAYTVQANHFLQKINATTGVLSLKMCVLLYRNQASENSPVTALEMTAHPAPCRKWSETTPWIFTRFSPICAAPLATTLITAFTYSSYNSVMTKRSAQKVACFKWSCSKISISNSWVNA